VIWAKLLCTKTNHIGFQSPQKSEKGEIELVQLWQQLYCQRTRVSNLKMPGNLEYEIKKLYISEQGIFHLVENYSCMYFLIGYFPSRI
jgi:hypothetical protein